jgi:hypothetical protein
MPGQQVSAWPDRPYATSQQAMTELPSAARQPLSCPLRSGYHLATSRLCCREEIPMANSGADTRWSMLELAMLVGQHTIDCFG